MKVLVNKEMFTCSRYEYLSRLACAGVCAGSVQAQQEQDASQVSDCQLATQVCGWDLLGFWRGITQELKPLMRVALHLNDLQAFSLCNCDHSAYTSPFTVTSKVLMDWCQQWRRPNLCVLPIADVATNNVFVHSWSLWAPSFPLAGTPGGLICASRVLCWCGSKESHGRACATWPCHPAQSLQGKEVMSSRWHQAVHVKW